MAKDKKSKKEKAPKEKKPKKEKAPKPPKKEKTPKPPKEKKPKKDKPPKEDRKNKSKDKGARYLAIAIGGTAPDYTATFSGLHATPDEASAAVPSGTVFEARIKNGTIDKIKAVRR